MKGTKQKRKLLTKLRPPQDIRDNTKARRAWLAEKLDEVNKTPGREGKIVGTGSYQEVSVYEVSEVEGRVRLRGTCPFCGNSQVVAENGLMVLHGYERPGYGFIRGRCPGVEHLPLNVSDTYTKRWLAEWTEYAAETLAHLTRKEQEKREASRNLHDLSDDLFSEGYAAYRALPRVPRNPTREQEDAFTAARAVWGQNYPVHAADMHAEAAYNDARQANWQADGMVSHFQNLLDSGIHGTDLAEEIVV